MNREFNYVETLERMTFAELDQEAARRFDNFFQYGAGEKLIQNKLWPEFLRRGRRRDYERIQKERKAEAVRLQREQLERARRAAK